MPVLGRAAGVAARLGLMAMAAAFCVAPSAAAAPAPRISIATLDQLPKPLPYPYSEGADAAQAVAAARTRARRAGKLLLIDLGGNWCADCRLLAGVMALPEMRRFLSAHYEVVTVDIGRMTLNQAIPAHYGIARLEGVPALLVVEPKRDRLVNGGRIFALADARAMTPQALADWLAQWV